MKTATLVYFDNFVKSLASSYCLAFPFFCQFQPGVAYKSVAYKKAFNDNREISENCK